ncbi:MAG: alanine dehydrogenase [Desulfomonilia bacterium]
MNIGIPREITHQEYRVSLTPDGVRAFHDSGHRVFVEHNAGSGCSIPDEDYLNAGATILDTPEELYSVSNMIYKVKEPLAQEYDLLQKDQILFAFLHLAAHTSLTTALLERGVTAIAFETIQRADGHLPLLEPMSEIAGRLSVQEGSRYLEKIHGGRGILLGGIPGVERGTVTIIGGGTVGKNAALIARGMGARVFILDIDKSRLQYLDSLFGSNVDTLFSTQENVFKCLRIADLVIGAVLVPGASAPKIVKRKDLGIMKPASVVVDVAVDQGGCFETSRPTYHDDPVFLLDGIIHYCVANIPGIVPVTSTLGLAGATLPYALKIASLPLKDALKDASIAKGVNVYKGSITHPALASSLSLPYTQIEVE